MVEPRCVWTHLVTRRYCRLSFGGEDVGSDTFIDETTVAEIFFARIIDRIASHRIALHCHPPRGTLDWGGWRLDDPLAPPRPAARLSLAATAMSTQ